MMRLNSLIRTSTLAGVFLLFTLVQTETARAQGNGDFIGFQGTDNFGVTGARSLQIAGAYTGVSGHLESLFSNPAGLVSISGPQFAVSAQSAQTSWWENQRWRDLGNRRATLSLLLGGLYMPDPEDSGKSNHDIHVDPSEIATPRLGAGPFDADAADWEEQMGGAGQPRFNHMAAAWPFDLGKNAISVAASFGRTPVYDLDRNETFLDPHIGTDDPRLFVDSVAVNWSRFRRARTGTLNTIAAALAFARGPISVGLRLEGFGGETSDAQTLNRVGKLIFPDVAAEGGGSQPNMYIFAYDTLTARVRGTSEFSGMRFSFGGMYDAKHLSAGATVRLPYSLDREWSYTRTVAAPSGDTSVDSTGAESLHVPAIVALGVSVRPVDAVMLSFDVEMRRHGDAEIESDSGPARNVKWVNQRIMRFGASYNLIKPLWLSVGYGVIPQPFVPDGAAFADAGPEARSLTAGIRVDLPFGALDLAYELRQLRYFDVYATNSNYSWTSSHRYIAGYTVTL